MDNGNGCDYTIQRTASKRKEPRRLSKALKKNTSLMELDLSGKCFLVEFAEYFEIKSIENGCGYIITKTGNRIGAEGGNGIGRITQNECNVEEHCFVV